MAVISELIRSEADGTISFGDYTLADKKKLEDFKHDGDLYKVKTFSDITKLERNGMFVYESVPGTAVEKFNCTSDSVSFTVEKGVDFSTEVQDFLSISKSSSVVPKSFLLCEMQGLLGQQ